MDKGPLRRVAPEAHGIELPLANLTRAPNQRMEPTRRRTMTARGSCVALGLTSVTTGPVPFVDPCSRRRK